MAETEARSPGCRVPEPVVLLLFFAIMLTESVSGNFLIYRTCYALLGFNETECARLGSRDADNATEELEREVQPYANVVGMVMWPAQVLPALLCLFVGPWSDRNGRKPVMVSAFVGFILSSALQVGVALVPSLSPWYLAVPSVVGVLFGGFSPVLMLILCYITDITTEEDRGIRLGLFEAMLGLGSLLGTLASSFLLDLAGYAGVFAAGGACNLLALLYVVFLLPETVDAANGAERGPSVISLSNVKENFRALLRRRERHLRAVILLSMLTMMLYVATNADGAVTFYYLRAKFRWDLRKFTLFKSVRDSVFMAGGLLGIVVLHRRLKFHETTIVLVACVLLCNSYVMQALAEVDWQIFLAAGLRVISGTAGPMVRSFISKLVSHADIGKIFSITLTLEMFAMIIGAPVYTLLYNATLDSFPGAFNLFTASIFLVMITITMVVIILKNKYLGGTARYELLVNTDVE